MLAVSRYLTLHKASLAFVHDPITKSIYSRIFLHASYHDVKCPILRDKLYMYLTSSVNENLASRINLPTVTALEKHENRFGEMNQQRASKAEQDSGLTERTSRSYTRKGGLFRSVVPVVCLANKS